MLIPMPTPDQWSPDLWLLVEERAAIKEFDAGMDREAALKAAMEELWQMEKK